MAVPRKGESHEDFRRRQNGYQKAHQERKRLGIAGTLPRRTPEMRQLQLEETTTMFAPLQQPAWEMPIAVPPNGLRIAFIPDAQVKPGVPTDHLRAAGNYIADKRPDVVVCIGDFADMASLSRHEDPASKSMEGRRYIDDIDASKRAMEQLMAPIHACGGYAPHLIFTLGNHEDRIVRAVDRSPRELDGVISLSDLELEQHGWKVAPFLQPVVIGGVAFCHYFPSGKMGAPIQTAHGLIDKMHMSAIAGHQQGKQIAFAKRGDGSDITAIISGSFYQHDEHYLSPFTNRHWRGMWFFHEVQNGAFDEMALSVNYLLRKWAR